jgi:hypothetical protein
MVRTGRARSGDGLAVDQGGPVGLSKPDRELEVQPEYLLTSSIITGFPLVFAVLSGGRARIVALAFALVCLAIAGYGYVVMRRIRAAQDC